MNVARSRTRLSVAVVAAAVMVLTLVPASPASAGQVTMAYEGTVQLSGGVGTCGTGTFSGTATVVHDGTVTVQAASTGSFAYCFVDLAAGSALGSLEFAGHRCAWSWSQTGLVGVVTFRDCHTAGTAVQIFAPAAGGGLLRMVGVGIVPGSQGLPAGSDSRSVRGEDITA